MSNYIDPKKIDLAIKKEQEEDEKVVVVHQGKGTKFLNTARDRHLELNKISGKASYVDNTGETANVFIDKYREIKASLGVNTDKLLTALNGAFTNINNNEIASNSEYKNEVYLSFSKYAEMLGYDFNEKPTNTPEEAEKEKKRIKGAREKLANEIRGHLKILQKTTIKFEEVRSKRQYNNKKTKETFNMSILGSNSVSPSKDSIFVALDTVFCRYLQGIPITSLPVKLFSVDARSENVWSLGYNMAIHYNKPNNKTNGSNNRLRVATLLKYTALQSYKEIKEKRYSWEQKLKEPLENYLDKLVNYEIIDNWEYRDAKGELIPDEDLEIYLTDYGKWKELRVYFDVIDSRYYETKLNELKK